MSNRSIALSLLLALVGCSQVDAPPVGFDDSMPDPGLAPLPSQKNDDLQRADDTTLVTGTQSAVGDDLDGDGETNPTDCDDDHASINTSATEICDGVDNDCDGSIDEGGVCGADCDTDSLSGYAFCTPATDPLWTEARDECEALGLFLATIDDQTENDTVTAVAEGIYNNAWWIGLNDRAVEGAEVWHDGSPLGTYTSWKSGSPKGTNHDCVTTEDGLWEDRRCDVLKRPFICETCGTVAWYDDDDNDGYGDPLTEQFDCQQPPGTVSITGDCDDTKAGVHIGAAEVCDGLDNDCDGDVDEQPATWYFDADLDGFGDPNDVYVTANCGELPPAGYISDGTDCDDTKFAVNTSATEACNGYDDDCDGATDEDGVCVGCEQHTFDGSTYQFCTTTSTWTDARNDCLTQGYDLVSIHSSAEQVFVQDTIADIDTTDFWIGMNDVALEGSFTWIDGSPTLYDNYASGQPNATGNKNCIELDMTTGEWAARACGTLNGYVCEIGGYCAQQLYTDSDGDGWGDPASPAGSICSSPTGAVDNMLDCDDSTGAVAPDAFENPADLNDDDCTGVDELFGAVDLVAGDLVITEISLNPSTTDGEWFEIYNPFGYGLSLSGLSVVDGNGTTTALASQTVPSFGRLVVGAAGVTGADVSLGSGVDLSTIELVLDNGSPVVIDQVVVDGSFPVPGANQILVLDPTATDASDNDGGGLWCLAGTGTPGADNGDCAGISTTLHDPALPARIDFDYTWTPGTGSPFGASTHVAFTTTQAFDPSGASAPGSVSGTFGTGNRGEGFFWGSHNEDGTVVVWEYDTGVVYRGQVQANGCWGGVMRVGLDYVGTWSETACP